MATQANIVVRDGTAYLSLDDPDLWQAVTEATSFKLEGADFRVRDHRRDKRTKLVRNSKAPVGLLDRICRVLRQQGAVPEVSYADSRLAPKPRVAMQLHGLELRGYQEEAVLAATMEDRGIFRMPTGSGKSAVALGVIAARGYHALIVVPTIDLLHQFRDYAAEHLSCQQDDLVSAVAEGLDVPKRYLIGDESVWRIGQLGDGVVDPQPVTIATIRTIARVLNVAYEPYAYAEWDDKDDTQVEAKALRRWVDSIGTLLIDEAHQLGAKTCFDVATKTPAPVKDGMSASPWRDDGADLMIEAATGPPLYQVTAARLVQEGYLMAPRFRIIDTSSWWQSAAWGSVCTSCGRQRLTWTKACECGGTQFRSQWNDAYRTEIVENPIRNGKIAELVRELDRPTLVLVKQVKHGRLLADLIPDAIFLSGRNKGEDRQAVFDAVRVGLQKTIICTTIADQGLDIPDLSALVLASSGKSSTRHLQRIGRVVRPAPDKPQPVVIDFGDGHVHAWFANHARRRRQIEAAEWHGTGASWTDE